MIDNQTIKLPLKWVIAAWAGILFMPIAFSLFGLSNIELGGKGMVEGAFLNTSIRALICFFAITLVFVGPYTQFIRPIFLERTEVERVLSAVFFLGLPLSAFAYYEGSIKTAIDYHEWMLMVLPAIILSSVFYERTEKIWLFATTLALGFLYPLYFLNDLMAPFTTLFNTTAKSEWLYFGRTIGMTALVGVIVACIPNKPNANKKREFHATVCVLMLTWLALEFVLPIALKSAIPELKTPSHQWEWALLVALYLFMFAHREMGELAALAMSATLLVASSYSIVDLMHSFERDFWKLTWAAFHLSVLIASANIFVLMRARVMELKPLFRLRKVEG